MIFGELLYTALLLAALAAYWLVQRRARRVVLGVTGVFFYGYYAGANVWLLLGLTIGLWVLMFSHGDEGSPPRHSLLGPVALAWMTIPAFILVLAYYKYAGFFGQIIHPGYQSKVIPPLAISFFTFEFIHLAAERGKGTIRRLPFADYFAFIFFFPTMVAGPIKRYGQFEAGFGAERLTASDALEGLFRILLGFFKKAVLADNLNTLLLEFGSPEKTHNVLLLTGAIIIYGFRIYWDFSGYSDIAIGTARLFGFRVPENFLFPYLQTNISNFWRHWHVSLYSWLIDYVFIPLGGSRKSFARTLLNVLIVMLISGIWHGAAWNFVLWGIWHGLMLVAHRLYADRIRPRLSPALTEGWLPGVFNYSLTMLVVWIGWMLFMWPLRDVGTYLTLVWRQIA